LDEAMKTFSRRSVLGALAVTALSSTACFGQKAADLTPEVVVQKSSDALKQVNSVHFKLSATGGMMAIGTGLVAKSIEGDVVKPDRLKGNATSTFGKVTVDVAFVIVGGHQYITNPITKKWQEVPNAQPAPNLLDPERGAAALLKQVTDVKKLENEKIDGTDCYHLAGKVTSTLVAGLVGATGTESKLDGDLWIGATDFLVRQLGLAGPVTSDEPPAIKRMLQLTSYNEAVAIEAPV
jgi:LppX_LprAFG lipoprotein